MLIKMKTKNVLLILFYVFIACTSLINGQTELITPKSNQLQIKYLKPSEVSFKVIMESNGNKKDLGLLIDQIKIIEWNGNKCIERIQQMPNINLIDTSINNINSLSPVFHAGHNPSGYMRLNFETTTVTGEKYFSNKDSLIKFNTKMPAPYFDSNMFEVILSLLPLSDNFKAQIPYYEFESGGYTIYKAKVNGSKKVKNPKGSFENTWILETEHNGTRSVFYISKSKREILKKEIFRSPTLKIVFDRVD